MKTYLSLTMVAMMAAGACTHMQGCKQEPKPSAATSAPAAAAPDAIAQKLCPVTGDPVNPNIYVDYKGRRIYFCCNMCPDTFKKDPEKYLKKLDEQMKSGAVPAAPQTEAKPATPAAAVVYTCPMHPDVKSHKPGKCPKCGMALVPVAPEKGPSGDAQHNHGGAGQASCCP
jgi:YHS domain-containing protein